MALFQYTMSELRERFVRERFAEDALFGDPDIEEWLAIQRITPWDWDMYDGDRSDKWNCYLWYPNEMKFAAKGQELCILHTCSAPVSIEEPLFDDDDAASVRRIMRPLFLALDPTKTALYCGIQQWIVLLKKNTEQPAIVFAYEIPECNKNRDRVAVDELSSPHVMDVLLETWKRGGEKAKEAGTFLCDQLARCIEKERRAAEQDFDRAVAVSEDGTEIVHATKVIVFDGKKYLFYAPESFFMQKIRRIPDMARHTEYLENVALGVSLAGERGQWLFVDSEKDHSTFVTHKDFCPDPLPAPLPEPTPAKA